jgi:hypothetical protein
VVDFGGVQVGRDEGVPELERRAELALHGAADEEDDRDGSDREEEAAEPAADEAHWFDAFMNLWKKGKHFFFEKKKQKTFIHCRWHGVRIGELGARRNR